jgi:hypothetical protein
MMVPAIKCLKCNDIVWSRHRHDCRWCKCKSCFIDGGGDYARYGVTDSDYEILEIEVDDGHMDNGRRRTRT